MTLLRVITGFLLVMLTPALLLLSFVLLTRSTAPDMASRIVGLIEGATPLAVLAMLGTIIASLPVLAVVMRVLHHVPLTWLFAPSPQPWRWFFAAFCLVLGVQLAITALSEDTGARQNTALWVWLLWLLPALLAVLAQSATEELIFRGYLQRLLRARFVALWPALLIPALLFGAGHYTPDIYGQNAWLVVGVTALWGLILAHLTWQCGSILPAIGIHFANNCVALLVISYTKQMSGLALFVAPIDPGDIAATRGMLLHTLALELSLYGLYQLGRALWYRHRRSVLQSTPPPSI